MMSGGSLNYFYSDLESHIGDFDDKELDDLVRDLAELFHAREWYLSSDTNEGTWKEARDEFKTKWFTPLAREERVKKYLEEIRDEVLDAFGLSDRRCKNCKHWTQDKRENYVKYGTCDIITGCLMHRNEACEKFNGGDRRMTMPDRENVIKTLEKIKAQTEEIGLDKAVLAHKFMDEIMNLLKEQEPVEPTFRQDEKGIFVWCCGSCGAYMYHIYDGIDKAKEYAKFCRQCGRQVKWE